MKERLSLIYIRILDLRFGFLAAPHCRDQCWVKSQSFPTPRLELGHKVMYIERMQEECLKSKLAAQVDI